MAAPEAIVVPSLPRSVQLVRRYAVRICAEQGLDDRSDVAALLVSEVTTNALIHGRGEVRVCAAAAGPGRLRFEVSDDDPAWPVVRPPTPTAEGGRGMALVEALAADWGVIPRSGGKTVWFEIAV